MSQPEVKRVEPMTLEETEHDRHCLFPIRRQGLYNIYKDFVTHRWTFAELDFGEDRVDFQKMSPVEQQTCIKILGFFANADNVVMENLNSRFCQEIVWPEAQLALAEQRAMEGVHTVSYNLMIDALVETPDEKRKLFEAVKHHKSLKDKVDWALKWVGQSRDLSTAIVAEGFSEGGHFSSSFAFLGHLRQAHRCPGVCYANQLIARDEGEHVKLFAELYRLCRYQMLPEDFEQLVREAAQLEVQFVEDVMPTPMLGMNATLMTQYVHHVFDYVSSLFGGPVLFGDRNPFPFMDTFATVTQTNFFERRVPEYQQASEHVDWNAVKVNRALDF